MIDNIEWQELIDRHLRGELTEEEKERLAELIDSDVALRKDFVERVQWDTDLAAALRNEGERKIDAFEQSILNVSKEKSGRAQSTRHLQRLLTVATLVIVALSSALIYDKTRVPSEVVESGEEPVDTSVARITGLNGGLIWTGDRGEIVRDISVGTELAGGTIEGLAPDSWFELQFHDGSNVTISGTSMLTFADAGQKTLRLREGRLSADVVPQPEGKPMLIHTRTALLSVLGTQFEVEAGLISTVLNVNEGKVRLRRHSDGSEVDVPAQHLVIADDESILEPERMPDSVNQWATTFDVRRDYYGKWQPATPARPSSLKAIPLVPPSFPEVTLYLAGLSVDRSDNSPVVVQPGARFVVRGVLKDDARVFFGIRVSDENGDFAGMFRGDLKKLQPVASRDEAGRFEEVYDLHNFTLDPVVHDQREHLAAKPDGLVLDGVWAFTHTGKPSGLALTEVELIPPEN